MRSLIHAMLSSYNLMMTHAGTNAYNINTPVFTPCFVMFALFASVDGLRRGRPTEGSLVLFS